MTFELMDTSFFLARETVVPTHLPGMSIWRERVFAWMHQNAAKPTDFFSIPANRVVGRDEDRNLTRGRAGRRAARRVAEVKSRLSGSVAQGLRVLSASASRMPRPSRLPVPARANAAAGGRARSVAAILAAARRHAGRRRVVVEAHCQRTLALHVDVNHLHLDDRPAFTTSCGSLMNLVDIADTWTRPSGGRRCPRTRRTRRRSSRRSSVMPGTRSDTFSTPSRNVAVLNSGADRGPASPVRTGCRARSAGRNVRQRIPSGTGPTALPGCRARRRCAC